jgi:hypothetical protein
MGNIYPRCVAVQQPTEWPAVSWRVNLIRACGRSILRRDVQVNKALTPESHILTYLKYLRILANISMATDCIHICSIRVNRKQVMQY